MAGAASIAGGTSSAHAYSCPGAGLWRAAVPLPGAWHSACAARGTGGAMAGIKGARGAVAERSGCVESGGGEARPAPLVGLRRAHRRLTEDLRPPVKPRPRGRPSQGGGLVRGCAALLGRGDAAPGGPRYAGAAMRSERSVPRDCPPCRPPASSAAQGTAARHVPPGGSRCGGASAALCGACGGCFTRCVGTFICCRFVFSL